MSLKMLLRKIGFRSECFSLLPPSAVIFPIRGLAYYPEDVSHGRTLSGLKRRLQLLVQIYHQVITQHAQNYSVIEHMFYHISHEFSHFDIS